MLIQWWEKEMWRLISFASWFRICIFFFKAKLAAKAFPLRAGLRNPTYIPRISLVHPSRSFEGSISFCTLFLTRFWCVSIVPADLLSIIVRTIILVRRNRILQRRLNALRAETRRFLRSVLNNPENQQRRSQVPSHAEDSSSTEKVVSTLSPPVPVDPTTNSFQATGCRNRDRTNDESSSSDKSGASRSECWFFSVQRLITPLNRRVNRRWVIRAPASILRM